MTRYGCWMALCLALAYPTAGREAFNEETTTVLVEVPVEVTVKGEPVRGLTAENFEIIDAGKSQDLSGFEVVDLKEIEMDAAKPLGGEIPVIARRHFLLLFDLSFASPSAIENARASALELVDQRLHPADLVAVATYRLSRGIELVVGFTSDREQVGVALHSLGLAEMIEQRSDSLGLFIGSVRNQSDQSQVGARRLPGPGGGKSVGSIEAELLEVIENFDHSNTDNARRQITALSRSFTDLGTLMRNVDGRKHVVYFSEGFDTSLLFANQDQTRQQELTRALDTGEVWRVRSDERFGSAAAVNVFSDMIEEFKRADCTIHSIDIGGLRSEIEKASRPRGKDGLFMIADGTGGDFYENFNRFGEALDEMSERTSVTYLLAFHPTNQREDGKYRKLKVKLKDAPKGAKIVHRPGYYAPGGKKVIDRRADRLTLAQKILDSREGGEIDASALALPLSVVGSTKAYVPVVVEVDGPSLLGPALISGKQLRAEVHVYAMNVVGKIADFFNQSVALDLKRVGKTVRESGFKLYLPLQLEPGDYAVRVLVRNLDSGATGLRVVPVSVPELGDGERRLALMPPMVPETTESWLLIRGKRDLDFAKEPTYPFYYADQSYVPTGRAALTSGQTLPVFVMGYGLAAQQSVLAAEIYDADGRVAEGTRMVLNSEAQRGEDGLDRYLAALRLPDDLLPGDYDLRLSWTDSRHDLEERSSVPFRVVAATERTSSLLAMKIPDKAFDKLPSAVQPLASPRPEEEVRVAELEEVEKEYRQALRRLNSSDREEWLSNLAELEVQALGASPERRLIKLTRAELRVAKQLADQEIEAIVPLIVLHHDLYLEHKLARRPWLVHHSVRMVRELSEFYARQGGSIGSRIVAARALVCLGGHLQVNGQSASLDLFQRALEFDPGSVSAYLGLASFYEKRGGPYDTAASYLERLVAAEPNHREGRLRLAINLLRLEREKDARAWLNELIEEPETDWIFSLAAQELARHHAAKKDFDQAIAVMESALERRPSDQKLFIQLSYLYERDHQPYKARQVAERLSRNLQPSEPVRGIYNRWPFENLAKDRIELEKGAENRLPILTQVIAAQEED